MSRRLIFMGSDPIALPALEYLAGRPDRVELAAVFTQPDRPAGRGRKLRPNEIKEWALQKEIRVFQPERLGEEETALLGELGCDLVLVMAYGHILRRSFLEKTPLGTFNLHASLLPKFRGASPIQAAIAAGESRSGVTLMRMVRRLDAGPVIDQESFPVDRLETGMSAESKMAAACVPLLSRTLEALLHGPATEVPQEDAEASYTRKLEKTDGQLDFSASAEVLARRVNGLHPWPGCHFELFGQRVKLGLADFRAEAPAGVAPGTVLEEEENALPVATGRGVLRLLRLQRPGGRMLDAPEFLRGFNILPGTVLPSHPMAPLVAPEPFPRLAR